MYHMHSLDVVLRAHLILITLLLPIGMIFCLLGLDDLKLAFFLLSLVPELVLFALEHLTSHPLLLLNLLLLVRRNLLLDLSFLSPRLSLEHHALISMRLLLQQALRSFLLDLGALDLNAVHIRLLSLLRCLSFELLLMMTGACTIHLRFQLTISFIDLTLFELLE